MQRSHDDLASRTLSGPAVSDDIFSATQRRIAQQWRLDRQSIIVGFGLDCLALALE